MNTSRSALPFDALLAHEGFVRSLARSLVTDGATADDVAQETWLAALKSPPRSNGSLRGWLASIVRSRASNVRRERTRRGEREQSTARSEIDSSDTLLRERLELAQSVVAAVLALDEPYRSVILQRYYEDLEPTEIARVRGVAPGTIRSQLSRGHELLREKLDRNFGDRSAWSLALLALAKRGAAKSLALSTKILIGVGVAALVATAPFAWRAATSASVAKVAAPSTSSNARDVEFLVALASPSAGERRESVPSADGRSTGRDATSAARADVPDLSKLTIDELLALNDHAQKLARERILFNETDWPDALRSLAQRDDTSIFWLLPRGRFEFEASSPLGIRGGGSTFSFSLRTHDCNQYADVEFNSGQFTTGYGILGYVEKLPCSTLLDVPSSSDATPATWGDVESSRWSALWHPVTEDKSSRLPEFDAALRSTGLRPAAKATVGSVYALRSIHDDCASDNLVAFQVVEEREGALRIAWRILHSFARPDGPRRMADDPPSLAVGAPPAWLAALDVKGLLDTLAAIRETAQTKLFAIDPKIETHYASFVKQPDCGLVRILEREKFVRVVESRGGGSCWSFATRDHDYGREPDVDLEAGRLFSRAAGASFGMVLDLGQRELDQVVDAAAKAPADLAATAREAYEFMWTVMPHPWTRGGQEVVSIDDEQIKRADEFGLRRGPKAAVGHSYLLRANLPGKHDLIAAFEVVDRDDNGITIAWKVLRTFPIEKPH